MKPNTGTSAETEPMSKGREWLDAAHDICKRARERASPQSSAQSWRRCERKE